MTEENFRHLIDYADGNGNIDFEDVVAVRYQCTESYSIQDSKIPLTFRRGAIIDHLKYLWIVYFDKYGNAYSRVVV